MQAARLSARPPVLLSGSTVARDQMLLSRAQSATFACRMLVSRLMVIVAMVAILWPVMSRFSVSCVQQHQEPHVGHVLIAIDVFIALMRVSCQRRSESLGIFDYISEPTIVLSGCLPVFGERFAADNRAGPPG